LKRRGHSRVSTELHPTAELLDSSSRNLDKGPDKSDAELLDSFSRNLDKSPDNSGEVGGDEQLLREMSAVKKETYS
jgi:hypothetical protein